ncbi:MAG: cation-translocating P-type ATPase [Lacibacter sp.]
MPQQATAYTPYLEPWHAFSETELWEKTASQPEGLAPEEVTYRQKQYGLNKLPAGRKVTLLHIIAHQLINPLIFILLAAAIASILIGEAKDAIFIFVVILINSSLGAYQEYNAEKSAAGLQQLLKIKARVRRKGTESEIDSEELVPGDVVLLESGLKVPADVRLLEAVNLNIDESFLTGESLAAVKQTGALPENTGVSDRTNMAFAGSTVLTGRGKGVVVATGTNTQVGIIARNVKESKSAKPPLLRRMESFIRQISLFILALSLILALLLRMQGLDLQAIFFFVVALAVSVIPEGLPVALTVALSIATKRMARRNVIVRRLTAVESLGSCTVIASDKTGTLTVNEQTARHIYLADGTQYHVTGEGYNGNGHIERVGDGNIEKSNNPGSPLLHRLCIIGMMANEATLIQNNGRWESHGDAMDIAFLALGYKYGFNPADLLTQYKRLHIIPYESEHKFSGAVWEQEGKTLLGVKGAVETILSFCDKQVTPEGYTPLNREHLLQQADELAANGYRVLALAVGDANNFAPNEGVQHIPVTLGFVGMVCFIDPLRPEAKASVATCRKAGIKVIMITGDHPATAGNIARELGIAEKQDEVISGAMLVAAGKPTDAAFEELVLKGRVFARVTPLQKLEIIDVLIRKGEFVAVTGDGVNDAPAMKRANIGVAMGSGTDVAKEISSMIVVDDNFSSIVAGVEEGRFAYDNVRKVIYLLVSTGAAQLLMIFASVLAGLELPLVAVQFLWLNLVTNGIQDVALAFEGGEPGAMNKPPRKPGETVFNRMMLSQMSISGIVIGAITFGYWYYLEKSEHIPVEEARNLILMLMVFMQNVHVFNCRSELTSAFKVPISRNHLLVWGVVAAQGLHLLCMHIPFMQEVLRIQPISWDQWARIIPLALPVLLAMELFKMYLRKNAARKASRM